MKKVIFLYFILFLSCDPGSFGLDENIGIYSYHDGMAFAWESFFEDDYDIAIAYINSSISETQDEQYFNSAYTALGWLYLFKSNMFLGTEYPDSVDYYRDQALIEFSYIENEQEAAIDYNTGCYYDHCCPDCFIADREIGLLYSEIEEYFISPNEEENINDLVDDLVLFVGNNPTYDFMDGKPPGNNGEELDLNIGDIQFYLSHVYFRLGRFTESCIELNNLEDYKNCNLDCTINWDNSNLDALLECLSPSTLF
tara:strand:- start:393 stop:1154 length:762 start_codon:yes stop_codon:yes gene_type:complete